jgi:RimJ/RimL family protein N-acetyltransferase
MNFFTDSPELDNLELGWRFIQSSWGKGYATEAALHIKNTLAKNDYLKSFSAIAVVDNLGSIAVMKKIGMSYVKTYLHKDPLFESQVVYYQVKNVHTD